MQDVASLCGRRRRHPDRPLANARMGRGRRLLERAAPKPRKGSGRGRARARGAPRSALAARSARETRGWTATRAPACATRREYEATARHCRQDVKHYEANHRGEACSAMKENDVETPMKPDWKALARWCIAALVPPKETPRRARVPCLQGRAHEVEKFLGHVDVIAMIRGQQTEVMHSTEPHTIHSNSDACVAAEPPDDAPTRCDVVVGVGVAASQRQHLIYFAASSRCVVLRVCVWCEITARSSSFLARSPRPDRPTNRTEMATGVAAGGDRAIERRHRRSGVVQLRFKLTGADHWRSEGSGPSVAAVEIAGLRRHT